MKENRTTLSKEQQLLLKTLRMMAIPLLPVSLFLIFYEMPGLFPVHGPRMVLPVMLFFSSSFTVFNSRKSRFSYAVCFLPVFIVVLMWMVA